MTELQNFLCATCGQHVSSERARVLGFEETAAAREFAPTAPAPIDGQHEGATAGAGEYAGANTLPGYSWLDDRASQLASGKPSIHGARQAALHPLDRAALEDEETYAPERGAAIAIQVTVLITVVALVALAWVHRHG